MSIFNKIFTTKIYVESERFWQKITSKKLYRITLGVILGAGFGLLYWNYVGCTGGTCPLTSNPYKTVGLFGLMGGLFAKDKKAELPAVDENKEQ